MRIRHIPTAQAELAASDLFVVSPQQNINRWRLAFADPALPLAVELGCGKGAFAAEFALRHQDKNLLAVDLKSEMLLFAKRKAQALFAQNGLDGGNLRLCSQDVERIGMILGERDSVSEIYINFCNPWPKQKHRKKRLTHTRQLLKYREFLRDGGTVQIKTDDDALYEDTLAYLAESGYEILSSVNDIYADGTFQALIPTEHELMFKARGMPIHYVSARKIPAK